MTFPSVIPAQGSVGLAANGVADTEIECRDPSELEGEPPGEPPGTVNRASYRLGGSLALQREPRPSAFPTVPEAGIHPFQRLAFPDGSLLRGDDEIGRTPQKSRLTSPLSLWYQESWGMCACVLD